MSDFNSQRDPGEGDDKNGVVNGEENESPAAALLKVGENAADVIAGGLEKMLTPRIEAQQQ